MDEIRVIGARVRTLREDRDLTQGQLAYKAATTTAQISRIEKNQRPGVATITVVAIAQALGTTVEYLCGLTNDPRPLPTPQTDVDLDPEHLLRLQELAERVARLPEGRQRAVMRAFLDLLAIQEELEEEAVE